MTEEQKKAIDACKDQAAQKAGYKDWSDLYSNTHALKREDYYIVAMKIYGDQCRKEGFDDGYSTAHADGVIQRER